MVGRIYKLKVNDDHDAGREHRYVVVLYHKSNKQCLLVPSFSAGGLAVEEAIREAIARGLPPDAVFTETDDSVEVKLEHGVRGHRAKWLAEKMQWEPRETVTAGEFIGPMKAAALVRVYEMMLAYAKQRPQRFAEKVLKDLKSEAAALRAKVEREGKGSEAAEVVEG